MANEVRFIKGGISIDDRGQLLYCNDFDMRDIKRFYQITNHDSKFIRAWHAHKYESKYVLVTSGVALVAAVKIDNWDSPSKDAVVHRFILSDKQPGILVIPAGYANGFKTLVPNTQVMFFSSASLDESKNDDYRFEAFYWNPWGIEVR